MKSYQVTFYYEESGRTVVQAKSKKDAEKKVYTILEDEGLSAIKDFNCKDRQYAVVDVEEEK